MDPISNVDRLVILLRQRLRERSRTAGAKRGAGASRAEAPLTGRAAVQALAAVDGVDDHQLKRALIQNILADQLGGELINEAQFQQVVDRVTTALESEQATARLLTRVVGELRASAGWANRAS